MSREEEEAVLRITSRYVAELRAGRQPRLSDYLLRYPQYADAITDFVTYYHAVEVDVPAGVSVSVEEVSHDFALPSLSENSLAAMDRAWSRLSHSTQIQDHPYMTLQVAASNQRKSLRQLAGEVGVSVDIVEKLERCLIDAATIPREFLKRLSQVLEQPIDVILDYTCFNNDKRMASRVAEASAHYAVEEQTDIQKWSFREALEGSMELSKEQKDAWLEILHAEGL